MRGSSGTGAGSLHRKRSGEQAGDEEEVGELHIVVWIVENRMECS